MVTAKTMENKLKKTQVLVGPSRHLKPLIKNVELIVKMFLDRPFIFKLHVVTPKPNRDLKKKTPCMRPLHFFSGTSMTRHHCGVPNIYPLLTGRLKGNRLSLAILEQLHHEQTHHTCWLHCLNDSCLHETCPLEHGFKCHPMSRTCRSEN